jgi:hypothetical protein
VESLAGRQLAAGGWRQLAALAAPSTAINSTSADESLQNAITNEDEEECEGRGLAGRRMGSGERLGRMRGSWRRREALVASHQCFALSRTGRTRQAYLTLPKVRLSREGREHTSRLSPLSPPSRWRLAAVGGGRPAASFAAAFETSFLTPGRSLARGGGWIPPGVVSKY